MERQQYGAAICAAAESRFPQVELLDDEPTRGHDFLYDFYRWILTGLVFTVFMGLRLMQVAGWNLQNAGDQFTGRLSVARRGFVVDFSMVSDKFRASRGRDRVSVLQRIRLWNLLDYGTSRMVDPGLAEHFHVFRNIVFWITPSPVTLPETPAHLKLPQ